MLTAQDFIRCLLEVDLTNCMSLTDALRHPWLYSSASSGGDAALPSATTRDGIDRDVLEHTSEHTEFPEDDLNGAYGEASMFSVVPSSYDIPGVHRLSINSPLQSRARTGRRSRSSGSDRRWCRTRTCSVAENDVGPRTPGSMDPLSMSRWTGRAPSLTRRRWMSSHNLAWRSAEGGARTSSRMARRSRRSGMVAGMARDAYSARGSLTLWAVRAANCMMDQY